MNIKVFRTHFLWVFNFGQVGGPNKKNTKTPSRLDFFEIVLKVEKNTTDFHVKFYRDISVNFKGISLLKLKPISITGISYVKLKVISKFGQLNL